MMKIIAMLLMGTFVAILSGCEYKVQAPLPSSTSRIAIPLFGNDTFKEDLATVITEEVINQFMLKTGMEIVEEGKSDYILKGTIIQYTTEPLIEITSDISEYRVRIEVLVTLFSRRDNETIWKEKISKYATYSMLKTGSLQTEEEAIKKVGQMIGAELVNLTLKGWRK